LVTETDLLSQKLSEISLDRSCECVCVSIYVCMFKCEGDVYMHVCECVVYMCMGCVFKHVCVLCKHM
jgi:hypothetical protein